MLGECFVPVTEDDASSEPREVTGLIMDRGPLIDILVDSHLSERLEECHAVSIVTFDTVKLAFVLTLTPRDHQISVLNPY